MYGGKGGYIFILGNTAGRPLINTVGAPRIVINGTSLDFLAESFMAGDPLNDGGFAIVNGVEFDKKGDLITMVSPYPGSNLFSLATGGALYIRDPNRTIESRQLNGSRIVSFTDRDWAIMLPVLEENQKLFGISIDDLLTIEGSLKKPQEVYRKIEPIANSCLDLQLDEERE